MEKDKMTDEGIEKTKSGELFSNTNIKVPLSQQLTQIGFEEDEDEEPVDNSQD